MDIVERLRVQEQEGVFNLPESHVFVGWGNAADEIERLRQQIEDLALVARGAAYRIKDTKKSQRFLAMINRAVGRK